MFNNKKKKTVVQVRNDMGGGGVNEHFHFW